MRTLTLLLSFFMMLSWTLAAQQAEINDLLKAADELTRNGKCDDAFRLLNSASAREPNNPLIAVARLRAHICDGDYEAAHSLVDQLIESEGAPEGQQVLLKEKAQIYLKQGLKDSAEAIYQRAIGLNPRRPNSYHEVARSYMMNGYYNDAVRVYQQGRKRLGDERMFATDIGRLYEVMRDYGDAAREYFRLIAGDTAQAKLVNSRMSNLIRVATDEEFETGLNDALAELTERYPDNIFAHKFYGDYLLAVNRFDEAFARYRLLDSLSNGQGSNLVAFCKLTADQGNYEMVEKACEYLKRMYPDSPSIISADFILGNSYFETRRYAEAEAVFQEIVSRAESAREKSDALFFLGYTRYQGLHEPLAALGIFDELIDKYPSTGSARIARLYSADCHLAMAEPLTAESLYLALPLRSLQQRFQEELLFRKAELYFFLGEYDAARDAYGELMNAYPKSVFVNDCLRRIMLITEYPDMDEITLRIYSEALYAQFRFEFDSALVMLDKLKQHGGASLAELAWYNSGEIYMQQTQPAQALAEFDSLIVNFPAGSYAPLALERRGDIYADLLHDFPGAHSAFERVLLEYPEGLNQEQVRKKLNRVEQIINDQERKPKS